MKRARVMLYEAMNNSVWICPVCGARVSPDSGWGYLQDLRTCVCGECDDYLRDDDIYYWATIGVE